jgi:starch synthase (maltosyl-transferring)
VLGAELLWRPAGSGKWSRVPMRLDDNDRWCAAFTPPKPGRYDYAIEAWTDVFATWRRDLLAKRAAGLDVSLETIEGLQLFAGAPASPGEQIGDTAEILERLLSGEIGAAPIHQHADLARSATLTLVADRPIARAGAWYEMVPRSQGSIPGRHGTFDDCIARLPDIASLGFDVVYLTPIHPI